MLRVVLDTNVFISAFNFGGKLQEIVWLVKKNAFELYISPPIINEIEVVLLKKFDWSQEEIDTILSPLLSGAHIVHPQMHITEVSDPDDNCILECALTGKAHTIVSGDDDLLRLKSFRNTPILTPRQFLSRRPWENFVEILQ